MRNTQLAGHGLLNEGAPFDDAGDRVHVSTSGPGRAKCSCGELSDPLPSGGARRRWHAAHKEAVRSSAQGSQP